MTSRSLLIPFFAFVLSVPGHARAQDTILGDSFDGLTCGGQPGPSVVATLGAATQSTRLGTVTQLPMEVRSCGYQGAVSLQLSGVPPSWTALLEDPNFAIAPGEIVYGSLTLGIPSNGETGTRLVAVNVAAGAAGNSSLLATMNVAAEYVVDIVEGAVPGNYGFPATLNLRVGTKLRIRNGDTQAHLMHFGGGVGIPHENIATGGTPPGGEYSGTVTNAGQDQMYCHVHGSPLQPMFIVASN